MKRVVLFFSKELLYLIAFLLIISPILNIGPSHFKEYKIESSRLESAIKQKWPSAEIVNRWNLHNSKLYVFRLDSSYRYIFFPKSLLFNRYAMNDYSILHTYDPFYEGDTIMAQLDDFRYIYQIELNIQNLKINKTGISPDLPLRIVAVLICFSFYVYSVTLRFHKRQNE